jgi:hypothetical protein
MMYFRGKAALLGGGMTRDETIALWQECEDARAAALAEGRSDDEANEEAKAIWNEWADNMCAIRHQLECAGSFKTKLVKRNRWRGSVV